MKAWHANLAALALLVVVALAIHIALGQGLLLNIALGFVGLVWGAQIAALWWSARQQRPPPPYTSTHLVAVWAAAMYPLVTTSSPTLTSPTWFVIASVPAGYLVVYAGISMFLWMTRWQFRLLARIRGTKT